MRRQFQREFLVGQYIRSKIESMMDMETGHEQVLEYYRQHPEDFQVLDNVQWLDIFVDAASSIIASRPGSSPRRCRCGPRRARIRPAFEPV